MHFPAFRQLLATFVDEKTRLRFSGPVKVLNNIISFYKFPFTKVLLLSTRTVVPLTIATFIFIETKQMLW